MLKNEITVSVTIEPTLLTASAVQVSPVVCLESNGSATVTPPGNGTYTYLWDNETTATAML
jgi:hypothetical protein